MRGPASILRAAFMLLMWGMVWGSSGLAYAQQPYLSELSATAGDPLFATYAAPMARSEFIVDEGYRFKFSDPARPLRFATDHAGDLALAFRRSGDVRYQLEAMASAPVVTASYSDLVRFRFRPFEDVQVEAHFQVYSSKLALLDLRLTNTGTEPTTVSVHPLLRREEGLRAVAASEDEGSLTFRHRQPLDGWMKRKQGEVPYVPERIDVLRLRKPADAVGVYAAPQDVPALLRSGTLEQTARDTAQVLIFQKQIQLPPGSAKNMRIVRGVRGVRGVRAGRQKLLAASRRLMDYDVQQAVQRNEALYRSIPALPAATSADERLMYWSAFNLMRQCMMPPEGKSSYNYYVFSREPTWGWGYGGQVFHESLAMLAYVFMDPESAQHSQRVYMERQWDDGYIPYRTGPYLDEVLFSNADFTTSAPWFSWENWMIYKETQDRAFLRDAYASGTAFYRWWQEHRDRDDDGLMEWGGHAVLESVRDASVAVWEDVGWPANFEAPELNSMIAKEARSLAKMAEALDQPEEARRWRKRAQQRAGRIQQTFWDEETGFFYYVDKGDHDFTFEKPSDLKRQAIIGFIPLWAGTATPAQAERLVGHLTDEDKFWRPYGVPSLAADDPFYDPQGYWNGPVWPQWQYLIFRGLLDYGYEEEARTLARRVFENVIYNLEEDHTFWEFYSPESHWAGYHQTYIWSGLVARMMVDLQEAN